MLEEIAKMLAEQLDVDPATINENTDIIKDLGADSLDVVELLMTLEEKTGKTIPEDKVAELKTVGDIVKVLETL
ncbi:MAG TPA: acyl carrier protein [Candidatus Coproplasma excrementigallinarum]|uniref:Acyl carrier protein n=1 Tax=Candidatus Coproplasma excrementigallinarum TaxID=2840747 RepID=A0A9D1ML19_9FIRM|nr:acyl carrier protein [Candidatus Coproplasma excrementigallinarum]